MRNDKFPGGSYMNSRQVAWFRARLQDMLVEVDQSLAADISRNAFRDAGTSAAELRTGGEVA